MFSWNGMQGERLDLTVTGYQFAEITEGYDANLLVVRASVSNDQRAWTASSGCVLTYDLLGLSHWFDDVDASAAVHAWCSLDIDLVLSSLGWYHRKAAIAVKLADGLSDPSRRETPHRGRDLVVALLSAEQTAKARGAIAEVLRSFPPRGKHGQKQLLRIETSRREELERRMRAGRASSDQARGLEALTDSEREVIRQCLEAAVNGPFFPEWEFDWSFGIDRHDVAAVLARWSRLDYYDPIALRAINTCITNLVGYPHGRDREWPAFIVASRNDVVRVFRKFRGYPPLDSSAGPQE